jgi:S-adenosyl-L-methionine hydrolase (adenosine-forming)
LHCRPTAIIVALMPSEPRPIVFVSDFGLTGEWVGICHAVLNRFAPQSPIVDLSHFVRPLDVVGGAQLLADSLPYLAENAVVLAVVDPNVGKDREVAIEAADGRILVGPDNGLLSLAWEALGGIRQAVEITSAAIILEPVAPSLHARDILSPAAAHLASGMGIEHLGRPVEPDTLERLTPSEPEIEPGRIRCEVVDYNRFGNIQLNVRAAHVEASGLDTAPELRIEAVSGSALAHRASTYADFAPGDYGVIFDPRGWLTVVRGNPGSALDGLGLDIGDPVWISATVQEGPAAG